jgi:hypothetical protein
MMKQIPNNHDSTSVTLSAKTVASETSVGAISRFEDFGPFYKIDLFVTSMELNMMGFSQSFF